MAKLDTGYHPGPFDEDGSEAGSEDTRGRQPQRSVSQRRQSADGARAAEAESNTNASAAKRSLSLGAAPRSDRPALATAASGEAEKLVSQKANGIDREPGADGSLDNLVHGMSMLKLGDEKAPPPPVEKVQRDSFDGDFDDFNADDLAALDKLADAHEAEAEEKHLIAGETDKNGQTPYLTRKQFHAAHSREPTGQEPGTLAKDGATGAYETKIAGEQTSKMLIRRQDGTFVGVDPERAGMKSLKAEMDKYGPDNVRLRTQDGRFLTHDAYNAEMAKPWDRKGHNPAEKAFAQFSNQTYAIQRDDAPRVALRTDEGRYESPESFRKKELSLEGRAVLIATPNGGGYVDPPTLKSMIKKGNANIGHDYLDKVFGDNKLPLELLEQKNLDAPEVLIAKDRDTLITSDEAKKLLKDPSQKLHTAYNNDQIFAQNRSNWTGKPTGNYSSLDAFETNSYNNRNGVNQAQRNGTKELTPAQKQELDIPGTNVRSAEPTRAPAGAALPSQGAQPARPSRAELFNDRSRAPGGLDIT